MLDTRHDFSFGCIGIAGTLDKDVENTTVLTDGAPKPVFLAANGDVDLIKVPFVTEPAGGSPRGIIGQVDRMCRRRAPRSAQPPYR